MEGVALAESEDAVLRRGGKFYALHKTFVLYFTLKDENFATPNKNNVLFYWLLYFVQKLRRYSVF